MPHMRSLGDTCSCFTPWYADNYYDGWHFNKKIKYNMCRLPVYIDYYVDVYYEVAICNATYSAADTVG